MTLENIIVFTRSSEHCIACNVMARTFKDMKICVHKVWNVDEEEGLKVATQYGVNVTPTYINKHTKEKLIGIVNPREIYKLNNVETT